MSFQKLYIIYIYIYTERKSNHNEKKQNIFDSPFYQFILFT